MADDMPQYEFSADEEKQMRKDRLAAPAPPLDPGTYRHTVRNPRTGEETTEPLVMRPIPKSQW